MDDKFVISAYGRIRYQQYGEWRNLKYRELKYRYISDKDRKFVSHCPLCGCRLRTRGRISNYTIDHIIPLWVCKNYSLPQLEFDYRNWRVMCKDCNIKRGTKESTFDELALSPELKQRILKSKQVWYDSYN